MTNWLRTLPVLLVPVLLVPDFLYGEETISLRRILSPVALVEPAADEMKEDRASAPEATEPEHPRTVVLGLSDIVARLQTQVEKAHFLEGSLQLQSTAHWDPLPLPAGREWELVLTNDFSPDLSGRWYAVFDVLVGGKVLASRHLRMTASLYREVWMAQQRLERGDQPSEPAVKAVTRDVFRERGSPVPATEDLGGFELLRTLPEGRLLTWDDLKERPAVRRGDFVEIRVEQGALTVTVRGRCLEDGLLGETVAVKNASSHRELFAEVVGQDRVLYQP